MCHHKGKNFWLVSETQLQRNRVVNVGNSAIPVDILLLTPNGAIIKELYDMTHTDNNPIFYLTPHGMKNGNKITNINAFTLWHQPSHGSLGNMNMLEYEGDDIK